MCLLTEQKPGSIVKNLNFDYLQPQVLKVFIKGVLGTEGLRHRAAASGFVSSAKVKF